MPNTHTITSQTLTSSISDSLLAPYNDVIAYPAMIIFGLLILLITGVKIWLAVRQIRHVSLHKDAVPAAFADKISLEDHQKAADYTCAKVSFSIVDYLISAVFILWLTVGGGFNWMVVSFAHPESHSLFFATLVLFAVLSVISTALSLGLDYYRVFTIEERFGFNRTSKKLWASDQIKGIVLSLVIELPLVLLAVLFIRYFSASWWLWLWAVLITFNLIMVAIYPKFIAPLFNKFTPLEDIELSERINHLLAANDFQVKALFVMDGSRRSSHGNAYFSGFGAAKRIVFFDTLLESLSHDEIIAVLAHELGHLKKRHIWKTLVLFAVSAFVLLYGLHVLSTWPLFYSAVNIHWPFIPVVLLLLMQLVPFLLFPLKPVMSAFSRKNEFEADYFASTQTSADHLISALVKLFGENASTLTPDPVYSMMYDSHPNAADRVAHLESLKTQ